MVACVIASRMCQGQEAGAHFGSSFCVGWLEPVLNVVTVCQVQILWFNRIIGALLYLSIDFICSRIMQQICEIIVYTC